MTVVTVEFVIIMIFAGPIFRPSFVILIFNSDVIVCSCSADLTKSTILSANQRFDGTVLLTLIPFLFPLSQLILLILNTFYWMIFIVFTTQISYPDYVSSSNRHLQQECPRCCSFIQVKYIGYIYIYIYIYKSVAYSSQGSHTSQLDFCNWLADGSTTG